MEKIELEKQQNKVMKLNLKDGRFFSGKIIFLGEDSLTFLDKYNSKIMISYQSISYIVIPEKEGE